MTSYQSRLQNPRDSRRNVFATLVIIILFILNVLLAREVQSMKADQEICDFYMNGLEQSEIIEGRE